MGQQQTAYQPVTYLASPEALSMVELVSEANETYVPAEVAALDEGTQVLFQEAPELVVKLLHLDGLRPHHIARGGLPRKGLSQEHAARREKFMHDAQTVQATDAAAKECFLRSNENLAKLYNWYVDNGFAPDMSDFSDAEVDLVEKVLETSTFAQIAYNELPMRHDRLRVQQSSGVTALGSSVDMM